MTSVLGEPRTEEEEEVGANLDGSAGGFRVIQLKIDGFEGDRAPGHAYQTVNLAGIFIRERGLFMFPRNKGRFYHDGRFKTLLDVVNSYDERFALGLTESEKNDVVEYLKSL